ncbi:MAG TPA: ABC transporter ATP-binding protein [Candidatus Limnocylindrales bacterium]|nr:ABC transporter ATP-binding protein [Candidatus Limnocylindrales bacterium]
MSDLTADDPHQFLDTTPAADPRRVAAPAAREPQVEPQAPSPAPPPTDPPEPDLSGPRAGSDGVPLPYVAPPIDPNAAIVVRDLGVMYSLKLNRKRTIRDSIIRRARGDDGGAHFWALRHVSFSVANGESLGVIGPNGAGKSTLLQVLAGILTPSEGMVQVDGHISSLLTLGVGFDQELSGVDNIRLAGAFMGMPHRAVEERLESIIEYAELGQFIDAPIKTYSSGMRARLGFAIATSVDPDILLLDEVLATGDAAFREKSKQRVLELVGGAKAIVLVTHDMSWVTEYCTRALLIEKGRIVLMGAPEEVVAVHRERMAERKAAAKEQGVFAKAKA